MKLVISAVNFTEGGPLAVLREVVRAAADYFPDWDIVVAVHRTGTTGESRVREIEFPSAKTSWLRRLWLEWVGFRGLSKQWNADVWLSLHDITPVVTARRQYVYCHNPSPFCRIDVPLEHLDPKFRLFRRFYGALYGCFIQRNHAVIVQQEWLREEFRLRYGIERVVVAHPDIKATHATPAQRAETPKRFFYPAFPRVFKNLELLGECAKLLEQDSRWQGRITLTIDGSENAYAAVIRNRYGHLRSLQFLGLQSQVRVQELYETCDALVFPSLLETWGLPLTEAKAHDLPILAAELPYARETVGTYEKVLYFDPTDAPALASLILSIHLGETGFGSASQRSPAAPYTNGWKELLEMLLLDDEKAIGRQPEQG